MLKRGTRRSARPDLDRLNEVNMADLDPNVRRRNWIVLIVLVGVALALYVSFMVKVGQG
jgi:uncharacterized protein involved in exopolysaccharide biosynthesis